MDLHHHESKIVFLNWEEIGPWEHLTMSGDSFGCHSGGEVAIGM